MTTPQQPEREPVPVAVGVALMTVLPPAALAFHDSQTGAWFARSHIGLIALPKLVRCGRPAKDQLGWTCGRERHADPWHMVIQSDRIRGVWRDPEPVIDASSTDDVPSSHEPDIDSGNLEH